MLLMTRSTGRRRNKRRFQFQNSKKRVQKNTRKSFYFYLFILFLFVSLLLTTYLEKKQRIISNNGDTDADEIPKISYTILTFSMEELKKSVTHRKPKSRLIEISSDMD